MSITHSTSNHRDALSVLGLGLDATWSEVEAAWKKRIFAAHPDRNAGQSDEFVRINEAYSTLKSTSKAEQRRAWPVREPDPTPTTEPRRTIPSRRRISERNEALTDAEHRLCAEKFAESNLDGARHIPHMIRRRGRQITYLIRTPLETGPNHVIMPSGQLVDSRKLKAVHLTYESEASGSYAFEVTEPTLSELFPGATAVSLEFGADI
ncbi:MAG: J domain-containing protein [Pseudomonadota bacterium]